MEAQEFLEKLFLDVTTALPSPLPLCHTSMGTGLPTLLTTFRLEPQKGNRPYPEEPLVFFFYGKASYSRRRYVKDVIDLSFLPGTFIYAFPDILQHHKPVRLFPFDSGAYAAYGLTEEEVIKFALTGEYDVLLRQLVKLLFGNNNNYLVSSMSVNGFSFEDCAVFKKILQLFRDVLEGKTDIEYGHQAFTFELQFPEPIEKAIPKYVVADIAIVSAKKFHADPKYMGVTFHPYNEPKKKPQMKALNEDQILSGFDSNLRKIDRLRSAVEDLVDLEVNKN